MFGSDADVRIASCHRTRGTMSTFFCQPLLPAFIGAPLLPETQTVTSDSQSPANDGMRDSP
jgi:hypothetical protein